jgi:hypothetical protein
MTATALASTVTHRSAISLIIDWLNILFRRPELHNAHAQAAT